ncbi:MAG TPA: MMPL family transporter [Nocardioides sp.]|uniref:MMPL family transporter n=1 Tax=Nocardioides sp. TaxID=35761 RepID=UPI002F3F8907
MHRQIAGKLTGRVTKWVVLGVWVIVVMAAGSVAGKLADVQDNQASSWLPGSAESTKALDKLAPFQDQNDIPTVLVYEKKSGLTRADLTTIGQQLDEVQKLDGAVPAKARDGSVTQPSQLVQVSKDGQVAQGMVTFNFGKDGWNKLPDVKDKIEKIAGLDGATVYVAGPGGQAADSAAAFAGIDGKLLYSTILVVVVILLLTYRSPLLWLLPVISAGVALACAQGVIYLLAKNADLTVNGQSAGILTVLVFGAGTDYALLLVARYREELHRHEDRHEAMAFALHRATPAIIASALTVVLGMLCLVVAEMNSTAGLGPVAAIGIGVGLLVMITLLPALLVIFGRWIFWPRRPTYDTLEPSASGFWARMGARIAPRPRTVWVGTALVLAVCSLGFLQLNAHGLATKDAYTKDFDSVTGQQTLVDHGLADTSSPIQIVANADRAQAVEQALQGVKGIGQPSPPIVKGDVALIQAPLQSDPTSKAAFAVVDDVRAQVHQVSGADALVGGGSAISADIEKASLRDDKVIIPLVLVVVAIVLMVLLRALLSPLLLVATVVLSFGASLGLSSLVFRHVFGFAGADASLPLFVFVFLVALGIDYNIFLMTRVREETPQHGTRRASLIALGATGGVITSAGLVLAATFSVLATLPLVAFAEIGFAVALGVLLDTMIVRSVLVTAINLDVGSKIWWPSKLDRGGEPTPVEAAEQVEALD